MPVFRHHTVLGQSGPKNWFGAGEDGEIRITSAGAEQSFDTGITWQAIPGWTMVGTVVMVPSVQDGDMVVVNARSLTVAAGFIFTVTHRCRGLVFYCTGHCRCDGPPSMTARGCHANPADNMVTEDTPVAPSDGHAVPSTGIILRRFATGATCTNEDTNLFYGCGLAAVESETHQPPVQGNGVVVAIPLVGGPGGIGGTYDGDAGGSVENGTGGGGGGAGPAAYGAAEGKAGTCFSGGPGSGGQGANAFQPAEAYPLEYAGRGGLGTNDGQNSGGGAGNPGGPGGSTGIGGNLPQYKGDDGTGGFLWIVVGGSLTLNVSPESKGSKGGGGDAVETSGAGSGGGIVCLMHAGPLIGLPNCNVSGGPSGAATYYTGGPGGDGMALCFKIDPA